MALSYMRRYKRWLHVFLWIIIAAFIVFYIPAFLDVGPGQQDAVARIGKRTIGGEQLRRRVLDWRQSFERQTGQRVDMRTLQRRGIPERVLQSLVEEVLIEDEAKRLGVSVDDAALQRAVVTAPQFQRNGQFIGGAEVRRLLELSNISEAQYLSDLRAQLLRDRLESLVTAGVEADPSEVEREYRRRNEQVKVEYALADSARYRSETTPTAEDVKAHFEAHADKYRLPERRVVSYVQITQEALAREVAVTEREAKNYYEDNLDEYTTPEQACASHVLVKVKTGPTDTQGHDDAQARTIAEGLLAQLKKGTDFAALAKKSSEDPGSAASGGDLQCFGHGQMVPEFDQAVFALTPGQISDLVKTPFGYHIIKLKELHKEQTLPFAQIRVNIENVVRQDKARQRLEEKVMAMGAALDKGESLEKAAQAQGFTVQKTAAIALGGNAAPLTAEAVAAAFQLRPGQAKPSPFAYPGGAAFVALASIEAPRAPELKDAEAQVRTDLIESRCLEKALALAQQLGTRARSEGLEKAARGLGLTRKETPSLIGRGQPMGELGANLLLEQAAFSLEPKKTSDPVRVAAGYAVIGLLDKKPFDPAAFAKEKDTVADSLRTEVRRKVFESFLAEAAERYGVERTEAFHKVFGEGR